jgi:hypothetical protein
MAMQDFMFTIEKHFLQVVLFQSILRIILREPFHAPYEGPQRK